MRKTVFLIYYFLLSLSFSTLCFSKPTLSNPVVIYPQAGDIYTKHHRYPIELLDLALSYHSGDYAIVPSKDFMTQGRAVIQLKHGKDINVLWTMTSIEREQEILPIRIPIYKGLIGWRLFLSTPGYIAKQKSSQGIAELKKAAMIQGHDWPDSDILSFNNFNIMRIPNYEGLFNVLSLNRAELFPRSIIEIWDELEDYQHQNIALEPNMLISYPTATYFFVSPDNQALANIIEEGLNKALEDGQFNALFNSHYAEIISKANLYKRNHFRLTNPLLPDATPLDQKSLWFSLDKD